MFRQQCREGGCTCTPLVHCLRSEIRKSTQPHVCTCWWLNQHACCCPAVTTIVGDEAVCPTHFVDRFRVAVSSQHTQRPCCAVALQLWAW